jgi:hypothetical protein
MRTVAVSAFETTFCLVTICTPQFSNAVFESRCDPLVPRPRDVGARNGVIFRRPCDGTHDSQGPPICGHRRATDYAGGIMIVRPPCASAVTGGPVRGG